MEFDTGNRPDPADSGGTGGGSGVQPPGTSASAGGEFDYKDPIQSFVVTVRRLVLEPANFFRAIRRRGDFINPLVFALICTLVSAVLGGIIGFLFSVGFADQGVIGAFVGLIGSIIRSLIIVALGLFIGSGIWHLLIMLFVKPTNSGYEATFRVAAYSTAVYLVSWIPVLGWILSLYAIFLGIVGIREVHGTTTGKAALVVLVPIAVIVALALIFILILLALGIGAGLFFNAQQ